MAQRKRESKTSSKQLVFSDIVRLKTSIVTQRGFEVVVFESDKCIHRYFIMISIYF